jgi:pimeloyl-ACP methyl ester carboxylesterase
MQALTSLFSDKDDRSEEQIETLIALARGFRTCAKFLFPIPEHGLEKRLPRIVAPTLIVWGTGDRFVSPRYAAIFHERIAGSELVMIENAGHLVGLERPVPYAEAVLRWGRGKTPVRDDAAALDA